MRPRLATLSVALLTVATPVLADDDDAEPWRFDIGVPLWAPRVDGNITVRGLEKDVSVSFQDIRDHLDASFSLGLQVHKGRFGMYTDGSYLKFSGNDGTDGNGITTSSDLKLVIGDAGLSYLIYKSEGERPFLLEGTVGARYWYTSTELNLHDASGNKTFSGGKDRNLVDAVVGLRASQYLTPKLHLDVQGDGGGFDISYDTDWTWSAAGMLSYNIFDWFTASAGYRALALDVKDGSGNSENGLNLTFHGPFILLSFHF
jgi:hypothetical protein